MTYYCWLRNRELHTNAAVTYPGCGDTEDAAREAALYYENQWPWTVVTPWEETPNWVIEACEERRAADSES